MLSNEEIGALVNKYFVEDKYEFPSRFEHRVDPESSKVMYSLVRHYKSKTALSFGTWYGGSTCLIMTALQKNKHPFEYYTAEIEQNLRQETLKNVIANCGRSPIMVGDITKSLRHLPKQIDFLFHDTNHDQETTEWVVKNIFPRIKKGSLVIFHDWAVYEKDGQWLGKGDGGAGGWPETEYLLNLHRKGELPLEKLYWNFRNPDSWELGCFIKT